MKPISDEDLEKLLEKFKNEPHVLSPNAPVYLTDKEGNLKRVRWSPLHWKLHNWWTKIKEEVRR